MSVRRATVGDEGVLRALRVAALGDAPQAFGSTLEREEARTLDDWRRWLAPGVTFLAVDDNDVAVGLVAGLVSQEPGVADLVSMWMHPDRRGTGLAGDLVRALVTWSEAERRLLRLNVVDRNVSAIALYRCHGFRATGDVTVRENGVCELEMARTTTWQ